MISFHGESPLSLLKCNIKILRILRGNSTQTEIEHVLYAISKLLTLFLQSNMLILKQFVRETQKSH